MEYISEKYLLLISFIRRNIFAFALVAISMLAYNHFLFNFDNLLFDDFIFHFDESLKELPLYPQSWLANTNMGVISGQPFNYPLNLCWGILARLGVGWNIIERMFFFFPLAIIAPLSSFYLFKNVLKSNIGAAVGSLLFTYNSYFMVSLNYGFFYIIISQILAPLFLLSLIKTMENKKFYHAIITGIVGFLITAYDFRTFYIVGFVSLLYVLLYFIIGNDIRISTRKCFIFIIPFIIVVLLNSFWLIKFVIGSSDYASILNRGFQTVWSHNLINSLSLHHPYYGAGITLHGGTFNPIENVRFYFWIIPIVAFFGITFGKRNKKILIVGILTLIFILIAKQHAVPFVGLYEWLYYNIPGFNAFREAGKFYFVVAMGYAILVGSFVKWIWGNSIRKTALKYLLTIIILFVLLLNTTHLFLGKDPIFVPKEIPEDYKIFKDFILSDPKYYSVLWVPNASKQWSATYVNNHPSLGLESMSLDWGWKNFVSHNYKNGNYPYANEVTELFKQSYAGALLDISSVRYVAIQLNDGPKLTESFIDLARMYGERNFFVSELNKLNYIKKVDIGTKNLVVYENENFRPLLYITDEKETIYNDIPFYSITYNPKGSAEYEINIENLSHPVYLNFAQTYHPGWKLKVADFSWFSSLWEDWTGKYFLSDDNHFKNTANLNSFLIDARELCEDNTSCYQNPNGSYNIKMSLYFKPQSFFYLGLIISGLTLTGLLSYLGYNSISKRRKNKLKKI